MPTILISPLSAISFRIGLRALISLMADFTAPLPLFHRSLQWRRCREILVFNVLTGNRDDHAKNFSFLYDDGRWWLSPAYDLVRSYGFNGFHSTTIAGSGNPSRSDIFKVAELTGFPMHQARAIFDQVFESCKEIRIEGF